MYEFIFVVVTAIAPIIGTELIHKNVEVAEIDTISVQELEAAQLVNQEALAFLMRKDK